MKHATVVALRGRVGGRVRRGWNGMPRLTLSIPDGEVHTLMRGLKVAVDGLVAVGARYVTPSVQGVPQQMRSKRDSAALLSRGIKPRQVKMTFNHMFGSCRMSADPRRGPVDGDGAVRGVRGLYVTDASLFPSGSAVNPQATVMALSDVISRRLGDLPA